MKKFMLLIREDLSRLAEMTEDELQADIAEMTAWAEALAAKGHLLSGEPLEPDTRYLRKNHIASDGPFAESRESISGYFLIEAEDLDHAARIAATCPPLREDKIAIEVRPLMIYA
ncbi:YciI family protein [Chitinophaga sp.]|uniref:YciI family protein n=1 Tax=Chitinophaga sp. TaxID=1869181 RepID=UPI0026055DE4|nr:YciI family protein [uncultured Chitinophaga sp.]